MIPIGIMAAGYGLKTAIPFMRDKWGTKEETKYDIQTKYWGDNTNAGKASGVGAGFMQESTPYQVEKTTGFGKFLDVLAPTLDAGLTVGSMANAGAFKKAKKGVYVDGDIDGLWDSDPDILAFRKTFVKRFGEEPSRDISQSKYDYDAAIRAGIRPVLDSSDGLYHWDSRYKSDDHPNRFVDGIDTKEGFIAPKGLSKGITLPRGDRGSDQGLDYLNGMYDTAIDNTSFDRGFKDLRFDENDPQNWMYKKEVNDWFTNPDSNVIFMTEKQKGDVINRMGLKDGGFVDSVQKIQGPSHQSGGVDKVLNGVPVEVEGGEYQFNFTDGSKAVFNKEQMAMYKSGVPITEIINTMPKNNVIAEDGGYYDWFKDMSYNLQRPMVSTGIMDEETAVNNLFYDDRLNLDKYSKLPVYKHEQVEPVNTTIAKGIDLPNDDGTIGTYKNESVNPTFFDEYNDNLNLAGLYGAASSLGHGIMTVSDMRKNQDVKPPSPIPTVSRTAIPYKFANAEEVTNKLDRSFASGLDMIKKTGRPELVPGIMANRMEGEAAITSDVNKSNVAMMSGVNQANLQGDLSTQALNANIKGQNNQMEFAFDQLKSNIRGMNIDKLFKNSANFGNLFGEYSTNKLSSGILEYLTNSLGPEALMRGMGLGYYN